MIPRRLLPEWECVIRERRNKSLPAPEPMALYFFMIMNGTSPFKGRKSLSLGTEILYKSASAGSREERGFSASSMA